MGCFKIADSVSETGTDDRRTCFGRKGADPARSINTALEGECLTADGAERTACAADLRPAGVQPAVTTVAETTPGALRKGEVEVGARPAVDGEQDRATLTGFRGQPLSISRSQSLGAGECD
jgi:hypothetical protein